MTSIGSLDNHLVQAIQHGGDVLPADLDLLRGYLRLIGSLLAEKASELEASLEAADASAAEIETLQALENAVAERAIGIRAEDLGAVRDKLAIWRALSAGGEEGGMASPRNRLVLSVEADLERLAGAAR